MSVDIHALSGAYAVGAVDDVERARFERHLADCAPCRAEVDSLREAAARLGETSATAPPPSLREAVLRDIQYVRPLPPVASVEAATGRPRRRRPALIAAAAAAAVVAILGVGAIVVRPWADDTSQTQLSASEQVIRADDVERIDVPLEGSGSATVYRSREHNRAVIVTADMPDAPSGHTYELWLQHGDHMVAAGQMTGGSNTVLLEGDPDSAAGVGITVERAGAEPSRPSDKVVAVVAFENA